MSAFRIPSESLTLFSVWEHFLCQDSKSCPTCTSPMTDRELATFRSSLFYWATLKVLASSCLWWAATCLTITSTDSLVLALVPRATKSKSNPSQVETPQIFKETKASLLQGIHHSFLKEMAKLMGPESLPWPWTCSRMNPLLKTVDVPVGIHCKKKFLNFIKY